MSVVLQIGPVEATIDGYEWECADAPTKRILDTLLDPLGPSGSDPDPDFTVAQKAIDLLGGEITHADECEGDEAPGGDGDTAKTNAIGGGVKRCDIGCGVAPPMYGYQENGRCWDAFLPSAEPEYVEAFWRGAEGLTKGAEYNALIDSLEWMLEPKPDTLTRLEPWSDEELDALARAYDPSEARGTDGKWMGGDKSIREHVADIHTAVVAHLKSGGSVQMPGNPPRLYKSNTAHLFGVGKDGNLTVQQGGKVASVPFDAARSMGAQAGHAVTIPVHDDVDYSAPWVDPDAIPATVAAIDTEEQRESGAKRLAGHGVRDVFDEIELFSGKPANETPGAVWELIADFYDVKSGAMKPGDASRKIEAAKQLARDVINDKTLEGRARVDAVENARLVADTAEGLLHQVLANAKTKGAADA